MASTTASQGNHKPIASPPLRQDDGLLAEPDTQPRTQVKTPELPAEQQDVDTESSSTPGQLSAFDWDDYESRYEKALNEAAEHEGEILREANSLSKVNTLRVCRLPMLRCDMQYFDAWASAASSHDDERALKRLRTRQRYINLAEEKADQRQHHYEEVVRAFENALALLQTSDGQDGRSRHDQQSQTQSSQS
ncbi:hypothetical protein CDD82_6497 [Ophiocordyceps australis]|uniref:Uncharacterized protein n=1 Tax=Ophiocordyceps australis TaxID=1399860 RepID=A0A2C5YVU2_9HYPO|nr:hypothetical protein CDD82_6497 [Ophiocordyceps australis]